MTKHVITLNRAEEMQRALRWIAQAPHGTRIEFKPPRRSNDQNALMWARLSEIARQVDWYGEKLSAEDWKEILSASLRKQRAVPGVDGGFVVLGLRTSDMGKAEMSELLELIGAFAAQHGVTFHDDKSEAA